MKRRVVHRETESDRYLVTEADVWRVEGDSNRCLDYSNKVYMVSLHG